MSTKRRLAGGILENILKYVEDTEVPPTFAVWSGVAAIASCLGRNCFVDQGFITVYPNVYIVLVAGSAMCKKSTSIIMVRKLLSEVKPPVKLISVKITVQALIASLGGLSPELSVIGSATGIAMPDELYTMINRDSFKDGMIPVLNSLYDCEDFPYETIGHGVINVRQPCLSILGGSTSEWIREAIPAAAIGGGFTSRVIFVYQGRNLKRVAWPVLTEENRERRRSIINDLCAVAEMRGPFGIEPAAKEAFEKTYVDFCDHSSLLDDSYLHGYCNRRGHILLKTAMAVSASRSSDRLITAFDLRVALNMLSLIEESMPTVLRSITTKEVGDIVEQIISYISRHKVVIRSDLVARFRNQITADELSTMIRTLEQENLVRTEIEGTKIRYVYLGA
jgi:hypothetical protein